MSEHGLQCGCDECLGPGVPAKPTAVTRSNTFKRRRPRHNPWIFSGRPRRTISLVVPLDELETWEAKAPEGVHLNQWIRDACNKEAGKP